MPVYAPITSIGNYQLYAWDVNPSDAIDSILRHIDYSFTRVQKWTTNFHRYNDQGLEILGKQIVRQNEFQIKLERWTQSDITALEQFIDSHDGEAEPFYFTAPDDGQPYTVLFQEPEIQWKLDNADIRSGTIKLMEAGDLDNSLPNDEVYPPYVEPPLIVLAVQTAVGATQLPLNTSRRLAANTQVTVGYGGNGYTVPEVVTIVNILDSTDITVAPALVHLHYQYEIVHPAP
jgi:hypothetical protein